MIILHFHFQKYLRNNIYAYSSVFDITLIQNKIMRVQNPCCIDRWWSILLQLFVDNTRLAMPKTSLDFVSFSTTSIKIWRSGTFFAFSPAIHFSKPLRKQKVVVRDLWLVDFNSFCVFLCFKVRCFVFEKHRKFYLTSKIFLSSLHWNMASLDSNGEIVPIELPNPEESQLRKGENEPVRSR